MGLVDKPRYVSDAGSFVAAVTKPALTFNGTDNGTETATYYFDGSDAAASDPDAAWSNDANAFDGSTSTSATSGGAGGNESTRFLKAEGTDAPASGGTIYAVRARVYGDAGAGSSVLNAAIYTDSLGELLGTPTVGITLGWGSYTTLSTPSGGWTWAKIQALETKIYWTADIAGPAAHRVEIEVTYLPPSLTYNIQIDTVNTFDSGVDRFSESTQDVNYPMYGASWTRYGQSFTGNGATITNAGFFLAKVGSPTGNAVVGIYAHTGTFGTDGTGTGTVLATSDTLDVSTLSTTFSMINFDFTGANQIALTDTTKYVAVVEYSGGDASNRILIGGDGSSPTHGGNAVTYFPTTWGSNSSADVCFYVNSYLLDKTSDTDPGFSGSPDNSDPFTSGQDVTYTVQTGEELSVSTTYYWRVRAKDSSVNVYSPWSTDQLVRPPTGWLRA